MKLSISRISLTLLLSLQLAVQPVLASFSDVGNTLIAGNDLSVEAGENYQSHEYHRSETKKSWGGLKKKTTTTDHVEEHLTHTASSLSGKGGVSLEAGNDTTVVGSKLQSGGNLRLTTGGQLAVLAAEDKHVVQHDQKSKSSFLGINYGKSTSTTRSTQTQANGSVSEAMGDMATTSGGSSTFQASQFSAGGNITLKAGVDKAGNILDPSAKVYFATAQEYDAYREELYKTNGLWFVQSDKGKEETTAAYNTFNSQHLNVEATGGIIADVGINTSQGETAAQVIGKLATQPGMEWLAQLQQQSQDPNNPTPVQWQTVETAFRDWDYKQEGLTPQAAALIAIAVAIATQGAGANLLNNFVSTGFGSTTTTIAATGVTTTTYTTAGLIANAGLTTLTQQAATTLINNKGDLGKTLKQLGSSDNLKSLATSMVTAGLASKLGSTFNLTGGKLTLVQQIQQRSINGLMQATVSTLVEGGNFGEALQTQLKNAVITAISGTVADKIGTLYSTDKLNYLTHKLAHAALGCAAGAAANDDCESGALGAVAGEVAAEAWFKHNLEAAIKTPGQFDELKQQGINAAELASAIAATLAQKDVNLAAMTARTAAENNFLAHAEVMALGQLKLKVAAGRCENISCAKEQQAIKELEMLDTLRNIAIEDACSTPTSAECATWVQAVQQAHDSYKDADGNLKEMTGLLPQDYERAVQEYVEARMNTNHYQWQKDNPASYGTGRGFADGMAGLIEGPVVLAQLLAKAGTGDTASQQALKDMVANIPNLPANIREQLAQADQLDASDPRATAYKFARKQRS